MVRTGQRYALQGGAEFKALSDSFNNFQNGDEKISKNGDIDKHTGDEL